MVRDFYLDKVEKDISMFAKRILEFCKEKKIEPSLSSYFEYKSRPNQFVPDCYSQFVGGGFPKEYFCNSKKFERFYSQLPEDFRDEITTPQEIKRYRRLPLINSDLEKLLVGKLKKDYVYYNR